MRFDDLRKKGISVVLCDDGSTTMIDGGAFVVSGDQLQIEDHYGDSLILKVNDDVAISRIVLALREYL